MDEFVVVLALQIVNLQNTATLMPLPAAASLLVRRFPVHTAVLEYSMIEYSNSKLLDSGSPSPNQLTVICPL